MQKNRVKTASQNILEHWHTQLCTRSNKRYNPHINTKRFAITTFSIENNKLDITVIKGRYKSYRSTGFPFVLYTLETQVPEDRSAVVRISRWSRDHVISPPRMSFYVCGHRCGCTACRTGHRRCKRRNAARETPARKERPSGRLRWRPVGWRDRGRPLRRSKGGPSTPALSVGHCNYRIRALTSLKASCVPVHRNGHQ